MQTIGMHAPVAPVGSGRPDSEELRVAIEDYPVGTKDNRRFLRKRRRSNRRTGSGGFQPFADRGRSDGHLRPCLVKIIVATVIGIRDIVPRPVRDMVAQ